mmetsp:Transcript_28690/g.39139  ORF Transcript_28690/g.39139 Transcript_28690/m.39139 type:complete len:83 (-) Transcript_28690:98-346(-)
MAGISTTLNEETSCRVQARRRFWTPERNEMALCSDVLLLGWDEVITSKLRGNETGLGGMELSSGERAKALARVRANQWVRVN